jgi:hypothetical protein
MPDDFDSSDIGQSVARPGMDTRQWTSIGIVENAIGGTSPVDFTNGYPLVNVRLHPSDIPVRCRVAQASAGVGEGSWHAIQAGDEVIVQIPQGDERAGGIITGHLSNGVDTWPNVVAGLDVTQNNINVQRTIPNTILEFENGWMVLNDTTQSQLAMDASGNWAMQSGEGDYVRLDSNGIKLSTQSNAVAIVAGGDSPILFTIDPSTSSITMLNPSGSIYLGAAGAQPTDHVATIEGVCNIIMGFMVPWAAAVAALAGPLTGATLAATMTPATTLAYVLAGLPLGAVIPDSTVYPVVATALATPRVPGVSSGVGCGGVLV